MPPFVIVPRVVHKSRVLQEDNTQKLQAQIDSNKQMLAMLKRARLVNKP